MIPKIIHYCWYGNNKKSQLILKCIDSWKRYFPEYEIKEWNESNCDMKCNKYVVEAYKNKKWAFVSDYFRMKVLYEYGGIYFDTDVEVIKPFTEDVMSNHAFAGIESFSGQVSPGLVFACEPGNEIVRAMIDSYDNAEFDNVSIDKIKTVNARITDLLIRDGYVKEDKEQIVDGIHIYPSEIFCAYDGVNRIPAITEKTVSYHHYAASWLPFHKKIRLKAGTIARHILYYFKRHR